MRKEVSRYLQELGEVAVSPIAAFLPHLEDHVPPVEVETVPQHWPALNYHF
jgi:hypothetical protein